MNPLYLVDFYKVGHVFQYPPDTQRVWSNWTARYTHRAPAQTVNFGLQYFTKKYLIDDFNENFFSVSIRILRAEYQRIIKATLGIDPDTRHIEYLHRYGRLPITIYALPEGCIVPIGVPSVLVTNTQPEAFWLPNYLETMMSNIIWKPSTSATTAREFRKVFIRYAKQFGHRDMSFVDWQGHDFSFRGMSGFEDAVLSGMGHLTSFSGTDTIPAILEARKYYGAGLTVGGSVPATEHSVMCAGGQESEYETFRRLITDVYPSGVLSIVSDTWNLWRVLTDYIPRLKDAILARNGKIVIRPDSGDPVHIMVGNPDSNYGPERAGVLRLLADAMGVDESGQIRHMGVIYGDGINLDRAELILEGCVEKHHLSPFNCVLGIGSYTYEYVTRDVFGYAMKATAIENSDGLVPIFKDPVTDDGGKKSLCGVPIVLRKDGKLLVHDHASVSDIEASAWVKVFDDGRIVSESTFDEVRKRARDGD